MSISSSSSSSSSMSMTLGTVAAMAEVDVPKWVTERPCALEPEPGDAAAAAEARGGDGYLGGGGDAERWGGVANCTKRKQRERERNAKLKSVTQRQHKAKRKINACAEQRCRKRKTNAAKHFTLTPFLLPSSSLRSMAAAPVCNQSIANKVEQSDKGLDIKTKG